MYKMVITEFIVSVPDQYQFLMYQFLIIAYLFTLIKCEGNIHRQLKYIQAEIYLNLKIVLSKLIQRLFS